MPADAITRLCDFALRRECEYDIVGKEARVFVAKGVSVRVRVDVSRRLAA